MASLGDLRIDLELLKEQKETLLVVMSGLSSPREIDALTGILNLLDAIQDELGESAY